MAAELIIIRDRARWMEQVQAGAVEQAKRGSAPEHEYLTYSLRAEIVRLDAQIQALLSALHVATAPQRVPFREG